MEYPDIADCGINPRGASVSSSTAIHLSTYPMTRGDTKAASLSWLGLAWPLTTAQALPVYNNVIPSRQAGPMPSQLTS